MTIAGIHLEPVPEGSEDFTTYQQLMNSKLIKLFKLEYSEVDPRGLSGPEWSPVHFFHGTGHCGCVSYHAVETSGNLIATASWCSTDWCAVRGILHSGHLLRFSKGGHFFSPHFQTALGYAECRNLQRNNGEAIFVCKARYIFEKGSQNFSYVNRDENIHPVFLAIVSTQRK